MNKIQAKSLDHDSITNSDGLIIPHVFYNVTKNVGYMIIVTNHNTSKFVCDNIYIKSKKNIFKNCIMV